MARFMAEIKGKGKSVSRLGHTDIISHTRGWDLGVMVVGLVDKNGKDVFEVSLTKGSNGTRESLQLIGTFNEYSKI